MTNDEQEIQQRAFDVEKLGNERYGDSFRAGVAALGARKVDPETITREIMKPDAVDRIWALGRDALIAEADHDETAARTYSELRTKEREAYRKSRGR